MYSTCRYDITCFNHHGLPFGIPSSSDVSIEKGRSVLLCPVSVNIRFLTPVSITVFRCRDASVDGRVNEFCVPMLVKLRPLPILALETSCCFSGDPNGVESLSKNILALML